jgi:hypothetical protein
MCLESCIFHPWLFCRTFQVIIVYFCIHPYATNVPATNIGCAILGGCTKPHVYLSSPSFLSCLLPSFILRMKFFSFEPSLIQHSYADVYFFSLLYRSQPSANYGVSFCIHFIGLNILKFLPHLPRQSWFPNSFLLNKISCSFVHKPTSLFFTLLFHLILYLHLSLHHNNVDSSPEPMLSCQISGCHNSQYENDSLLGYSRK